jgi:hypothetical protein
VRIVRERATGHVFAMKKLKKSEMVRRGQARGPAQVPRGAPVRRCGAGARLALRLHNASAALCHLLSR